LRPCISGRPTSTVTVRLVAKAACGWGMPCDANPGRRIVPERDHAQMRGREPVDEVQEDCLGVCVGRRGAHGVEHGVTERLDFLDLVGVLDRPGSRHHGVGEQVVVSQGFQADAIHLAAQLVDRLG